MSHSQTWHLSQETNKASGACSVCFAIRQLHLKDGTVHNHGPRNNPCPGSKLPPLNQSVRSSINANSVSSSAAVISAHSAPSQVPHNAVAADDSISAPQNSLAPFSSAVPDWAVAPASLIK